MHPLSCVLFGTLFYRCSENVPERRNRERGGGSKGRYTPSPERPLLQVCVPLPGFFLLMLYEGEIFINAKLPRRASPTRPQKSIRRAKIQTWQNGKISHARASRVDDAIGFNQPSPTHDRRRLPRYSRQLSFLRSAATIISAGYDYPLVGLTLRHGHLPLVPLIEERKTPICSMLRCLKPFSIPSQIYFSQDVEIWMVNA